MCTAKREYFTISERHTTSATRISVCFHSIFFHFSSSSYFSCAYVFVFFDEIIKLAVSAMENEQSHRDDKIEKQQYTNFIR